MNKILDALVIVYMIIILCMIYFLMLCIGCYSLLQSTGFLIASFMKKIILKIRN